VGAGLLAGDHRPVAMAEIDWARYAGQLRPLTGRDYDVQIEVERQRDEELWRAAKKEYVRREATRPPDDEDDTEW
jgi:hypothetical protein